MRTRRLGLIGVAALAVVAFTSTALAATTAVYPGDPSWGNPPTENGGGGSSAITGTAPRSGTGSLELFGDRTRFFGLGNPYSPASNLGLLSDVANFRFDWMVAVGSSQGATPEYSPALRLHIWDNGVRSELIWENAYNGPTSVVQGTWYSTGASDNFYQWISGGPGDTGIYNRSIAQWSQNGYSANAYVAAISVGVGSSAGALYHAFADNVVIDFGSGPTTYNFEVAPPPPVTKDDCKKGGWQNFARPDGSTFKNQGDCIQYVNTGK